MDEHKSVTSRSDVNSVPIRSEQEQNFRNVSVHRCTFLVYTMTEALEEHRGKRACTNVNRTTGSKKNTNTCINLSETAPGVRPTHPQRRGRL